MNVADQGLTRKSCGNDRPVIFTMTFSLSMADIAGNAKGSAFCDLTKRWFGKILELLREFEKRQRI